MFWHYVKILETSISLCRYTKMIWNYVKTLKTFISLCRYTKMIWNYIKMVGLVNLYVVFRNLVVLVITSSKTTWGYRKLQVSHKLEHKSRHYIIALVLAS